MKLLTLTLLAAAGNALQIDDAPRAKLLHAAVRRGDLPRTWALVKGAPDPQALLATVDEHGQLPLYAAACQGRDDIVSYLLESGSPAEVADPAYETPLLCAIANGHPLLFRYGAVANHLIEYEADLERVNQAGQSALSRAACKGWGDLMWGLLDAGGYKMIGVDCDESLVFAGRLFGSHLRSHGMGPIASRFALGHVYEGTNRLLCNDGVELTLEVVDERFPEAFSIQNWRDETVLLRMKRGSSAPLAQEYEHAIFQHSFLANCTDRGGYEPVQRLLAAMSPMQREAVFHHALQEKHAALLALSLDGLESLSWFGTVHAWGSLFRANEELLALLVDNEQIRARMVAMDAATAVAIASSICAVTVLLFQVCKQRLLLQAAQRGWPNVALALIAYGASVDGDEDRKQDLPLLRALQHGNTQVARVLLERGASTRIQLRALLNAIFRGNQVELLPLLSEHLPKERLLDQLFQTQRHFIEPLMRVGAVLHCKTKHTWPSGPFCSPEIVAEIARRGGQPELVYEPESEREWDNCRVIVRFSEPALLATCMRHVIDRERAIHDAAPIQVGRDVARLISSFG